MVEEKSKAELVQLVTCKLADEEYGVHIHQVQEIVQIPEITRIPGMPAFIEGVINLRGRIIPVLDLRRRFGLEVKVGGDASRIIVVEIGGQTVGLVVDSVSEVLRLPQSAIDPIPPTISKVGTEFIAGVGKLEKKLVILLDLEKILTDLEKTSLDKI